MAEISQGRWTARDRGRLRGLPDRGTAQAAHPLRSLQDLGGKRGMQDMLKYLDRASGEGLLGYQSHGLGTERAVLAVVRAPRAVRQGRRRPAPRRLARLLEAGRAQRPHRHLARDLPRPGRRVRGDLRQHAAARARQGRRSSSRSRPTSPARAGSYAEAARPLARDRLRCRDAPWRPTEVFASSSSAVRATDRASWA